MGYKSLEARREHYKKNKDKINAARRANRKKPEVRAKIRERDKDWRRRNKDKVSEYNIKHKREYEKRVKKKVFEHYGEECACCGEKNKSFLTIDHINGGGRKHREKIKHEKITVWLYRNNFPSGFQTLCFNCNWGKHINNGICPHKQKVTSNRHL